jgi:hypothetical protein
MTEEPITFDESGEALLSPEDIAAANAEEEAEAFHLAVYTDFLNRRNEALIAKLQR